MSDFHIYPIPETMKLDLMSDDQRRLYATEKRLNAPGIVTQMARILSDASREHGASVTLPEMGLIK